MSKLQKLISFLLCACMLLSAAALAEAPVDAAAPTAEPVSTVPELADDAALVTINDVTITWADIKSAYSSLVAQYGANYDMNDLESVELFRAVALENIIVERLLMIKAKELGLDQLTAEEISGAETQADADWEAALQNHISYHQPDLTAESPEADQTAAREAAVKYYNDEGFTPEILRENYKQYAIYDKVQTMMTQDASVTDDDVEKLYQELLAADKELYQNDLSAYISYNSYVKQMAMYSAMYGAPSTMDLAWYRPAGFRAVKHILLEVDPALMENYTNLQASYEEQLSVAEGTDATAAPAEGTDAAAVPEPTATPEPVTEEQINNAKAAILESLAGKIDEINQKIADGADFDELIATYGVKADGTPTDPGMSSDPYKTSGYEVAAASTDYYPEFVEASFSMDKIGDVSAPYLSSIGVHIVKYIADVPEGPIAMTDEQRDAKRVSLLSSRQNELYTATLEKWLSESTIAYTGATPSLDEIEAKQAAQAPAEPEGDAMSEEDAAVLVEGATPEADTP